VAASASPAARPLPPRAVRLILFALGMGGFAIGTSEFAVMGLMPEIARGMGISEPQVGHVISAYALGVVVGAPLLAILGARLPRRTLLLALMAFYALGNIASALSPGYHAMLLFRFIAGLPHGAYFGVAALVAASISRPEQRGQAVGRVMLGLSIALLTVAMVARTLPPDPDEPHQDPVRELRDFNRKPVWLALAIGAIGFSGMFCVFSYLAPTMTQVTGLPESWIPFGLVAFGAGGIIGTLGGGWLYDRLQFRAAALLLAWSAVVLLAFPLAAHATWSLLVVVVAVGTMGALATILQAHLMAVAARAQTLAAASNHSAFNAANALGPWLGGMAITAGFGWTSTGYVGAGTAIAGLLIYAWARRDARSAEVQVAEG
jgi:DHA1 family inner membrane transport protein